jgi:hypothetical protein
MILLYLVFVTPCSTKTRALCSETGLNHGVGFCIIIINQQEADYKQYNILECDTV